MPTFPVYLGDTHTTITRPVASKIVEDLKRMTNLDLRSEIQFIGGATRPVQPGSELKFSSTLRQQGPNTFPSRSLLRLEVSEEDVEGRVLTTPVIRNDEKLFFFDEKLGIWIRPVYAETEMSITVTNRFDSRVAAEKWRDGIRARVSMGRAESFHEIVYSFQIPDEVLFILSGLHYYRENNVGYGEDLRTWMRACLNDRATTLTDQKGGNPTLVMAEQQIEVLGWFDFEARPSRGDKNQQHGTWSISFDYKVRYQKAISVVMSYPFMIHNQLLPEQLSPRGIPYQTEQTAQHGSVTTELYKKFLHEQGKRLEAGMGVGGISIPFFDDWLPTNKIPRTSILMRIMLALNPDDTQEIINLSELGDYALDSDVLAYIAQDPMGVVRERMSAIHLTLYRTQTPITDGVLEMDSELNVRASRELSQREAYHLVVSLITDLMSLTEAAKTLLMNNAQACLKIFKALDPTLEKRGLLPTPIGDGIIARPDFIRVATLINQRFTSHFTDKNMTWGRITHLVVVASRKS